MNTYKVIADETELKWFFDNVVQKPLLYESYLAVFICRHKKLTEEEKETLGMSRRNAEFLAHQSFRLNRKQEWTFRNFLCTLKRFEVNEEAYLTEKDEPLPTKTLAILFYVNPSDDIKVCEKLVAEYNETTESILKAHLNGKSVDDCITGYRWFTNVANRVKHLQANQKGSRYWLDYDIDVPKWFKYDKFNWDNEFINYARNYPDETDVYNKFVDEYLSIHKVMPNYYYDRLCHIFTDFYGKGNYVIIDTSGGYHILVRTDKIKMNPHQICDYVKHLYVYGVECCDEKEYLDDNGNCKFECTINDSQIPGIPLPGTYQYGRPVTILNKGDFE